jgi:hypothetical protein
MEWIQQRVKADTETYAQRAIPLFKPTPGFAREWARLAKDAGCRYLVFTTKHHDGFALHDSKVSDYDAGSVLHRDLVKEIVAACRAEGLRVGFYHSVIDWHHDQYAYAKSKQLPHPLKGQPYPNGARPRKVPDLPARAGDGARVELRPGRHPLVGLQRAGLPGRRGLALHRPDAAGAREAARRHHEQPPVPHSRGRLEKHGHRGLRAAPGTAVRRLHHPRAAHPRHRHAGRRLGDLHDPQHHLGLQRARPRVEEPTRRSSAT